MDTHLVVGAGPVGTAVARRLMADGHHVRVVTRSGSGPEGAERVGGRCRRRAPGSRTSPTARSRSTTA